MHPIRIGLKLAPQLTDVAELRAVWRIADEAGFDHVWNFDHFARIMGDPTGDVLEGWTLLGAMAEATSRVRIGCMVTGNTYRHPGVLAKMAVTVDHLSGGRLELGLGAAWAEIEHTMLGLEFGSVGQRIARMGEACRVLKLLFCEERASLAGRYYQLSEAIANPKPLQKPYPPLWIGGSGERKTLRIVAEEADVWNAASPDVDECARLSGVLDRHCADVGRDPNEIRRSAQLRGVTDPEELLQRCGRFVQAGFTELVMIVAPGEAERQSDRLAGMLEQLRGLG